MPTADGLNVDLGSAYERESVIRPRLPLIPGIFDLAPESLIAAHKPHERIAEHLHDHLPHMHIRYGFEFPAESLIGVSSAALEVAMLIHTDHRVDCNPIFVARGQGSEGLCLQIAGQDVHWVHNDEVGAKATQLFTATGRLIPQNYYFSGFRTSDVDEREVQRYTADELKRTIGLGLRADQHFQATWREPRNDPIAPYPVIIYLGDDETTYHTFFELRPTVVLGTS